MVYFYYLCMQNESCSHIIFATFIPFSLPDLGYKCR